MEHMTIHIHSRNFSSTAAVQPVFQVEQLRWKAQGGPSSAILTAAVPDAGWSNQAGQWALDALRRPVEIFNQASEKAWWGFVQRVEVTHAGVLLVYDLEEMVNRVCVEYGQREPQLEWTGVRTFSPWLEDFDSQLQYGVKERIFRLGSMDALQAQQACSGLLSRHRQPQAHLSVVEDLRPGVQLRLICRGWWDTLDWITARFSAGYEGYVLPAQQTQYLGRSTTADGRIAQGFKLLDGPWKLGDAAVNIRGIGISADLLRCELCTDNNGIPGSVLDTAEVDASLVSGARWWVKFIFPTRVMLANDTPYWLVFSRSGSANVSNHFVLYYDNTNRYPNGKLMTWNGSIWLESNGGLSDINFYLVGYVPRSERIAELAGVAMGGVWLTDLRMNVTIDGDTAFWRDGTSTCLEELTNLLQTEGTTALQAQVDADHRLLVTAQPTDQDVRYMLDRAGVLRTRSGRPALCSDSIAGQRVQLAADWLDQPPVIEEVEWTPDKGLRVKW